MRSIHCLPLALAAAAVAFAPGGAQAAHSYDNCTGFIDSLPATISTQGTWCLNKNVNANIATGAGITIAAHNVTIDCNDYRVANLSSAASVRATGIYASARHNLTVRNCQIQNFHWGIQLAGDAALIEGNRVGGSNWIGIGVKGDGSVIRGNRVLDIGGTNLSWNPTAVGIYTDGDSEILGNLVNGVVAASGTNTMAMGINPLNNISGSVIDNQVKNVVGAGTGEAHGISFFQATGRVAVDSNNLVATGADNTLAVYCPAQNEVVVAGNVANGWTWPMVGCKYGHELNVVVGSQL